MRAVNGYLENGRFTPLEVISFPKRVQVVLVYNDVAVDEGREERMAWLNSLHAAIKDAADEEMPDFPRVRLDRELVDLSDEG
ncbi:MAG: hypothetical protein LBL96_11345 [Clostridiales bacterium]|jgi:hypothetical protein|nr:hypothetical protein [Clostridiales bacterium]